MNYEENNRYVHDYEDDGQPIPSTKIGYDNTGSGLDSTTVQGAIDEVAQILDTKQDKTYDGTESGIEADTVTGAIDELAQDMSDLTDVVENLDANDIGYNNTTSGLNASTVQGAIDKMLEFVDVNTDFITAKRNNLSFTYKKCLKQGKLYHLFFRATIVDYDNAYRDYIELTDHKPVSGSFSCICDTTSVAIGAFEIVNDGTGWLIFDHSITGTLTIVGSIDWLSED